MTQLRTVLEKIAAGHLAKNQARAALSPKLDSRTRHNANEALDRYGFGGSGRWKTPGKALTDAMVILEKFGIEQSDVVDVWHFNGRPQGHTTFQVAFKNPDDSFSPVQIANSVLAFSWTELEPERIEVIAYLS